MNKNENIYIYIYIHNSQLDSSLYHSSRSHIPFLPFYFIHTCDFPFLGLQTHYIYLLEMYSNNI